MCVDRGKNGYPIGTFERSKRYDTITVGRMRGVKQEYHPIGYESASHMIE
jgi:hypothetical protein